MTSQLALSTESSPHLLQPSSSASSASPLSSPSENFSTATTAASSSTSIPDNVQSADRQTQAKPTIAVYQEDKARRTLTSVVTSVRPFPSASDADRALFRGVPDDAFIVVTRETIFYAQGGGQPSDTGTMQDLHPTDSATFEVSLVRNASGGRILHMGKFIPRGSHPFKCGDMVHQAIDGTKRDLNSRVHTAGHLVSLAVRRLMTAPASEGAEPQSLPSNLVELKAMHYPDSSFVEFEGLIDGKHKDAIQHQTNDFIRKELPVKLHWYKPEELEQHCAVVPKAVELPQGGLVRVVDIEGAGAYPCGGTHVKHSGQVGQVTIRKISRQKGVSKISYSTTDGPD